MPKTINMTATLTEPLVRRYAPTSDAPAALPDGADRARIWDDLAGFYLVIGRRAATFYTRYRAAGKRVDKKIGEWGRPGAGEDEAQVWTVDRAKRVAMKLLGARPAPEPKGEAGEGLKLTLRQGLGMHVQRMRSGENRKKPCSPRSIATIEREVALHLKPWLDQPLAEIDRAALRDLVEQIERSTPRRAGSNPANVPGRALAHRILSHVSAIWATVDDELAHRRPPLALPKCPTWKFARGKPRDTRIPDGGFAAWFAVVQAMPNAVRRDLQLMALFSAVRSDGLRNLTWDEADFDKELIQIERAKGDKPYTIPMTATLREVLERRLSENRTLFALLGGDHDYVFPSISRSRPFRVIPLAEPKEHDVDEDGKRIPSSVLLGVHASRRTYNSVALEIGVPPEIRERLLNHAGRGINTRVYGMPQDWGPTREWADKIEAAIWEKIRGGGGKRRGRAKLRSVPRPG